jgi:two-component system response regulator FixJ
MNAEPTVFIVDGDSALGESLAVMASSMQFPTRRFASPDEYLEQFDAHVPGCLILDVCSRTTIGLVLQEKLAQLPVCPPIIVMTNHEVVPAALRAIQNGAVAFLPKSFGVSDFCGTIERAFTYDAKNRATFASQAEVADRFIQLRDAEKKVLEQVLLGVPNKRIATLLHVSRRTVEDRRARVMRKLKVASLADLVRLALDAGMRTE